MREDEVESVDGVEEVREGVFCFSFDRVPTFFDGVEVGGIRGKVKEFASGFFDEFGDFTAFMEGGVVHDYGVTF